MRYIKNVLLVLAMFAAMPSVSSAANTIYKYDALGRVIEVVYPNGSKITYTYDSAGNRIQVNKSAS